MNVRFARMSIALYGLLAIGACTRGQPLATRPVPVKAYADALKAAEERVASGDHAGADRILSDFALGSKGSEEATEVSFWRALYMVDPANKRTSIPEGIRALDIYLSTPGTIWYRNQAEVLRRTAQSVQALRTAAQAQPRIVGRDTVYVTRDEEIVVLRDQLAKATAELERIKKRLANPSR